MRLNGTVLRWLWSYLYNGTQIVVVKKSASVILTINAGCPCGSVPGLLLAILHLNDLDVAMLNELFYNPADDTVLFKSHAHTSGDEAESVQRDLDKIEQFGKNGKLPLKNYRVKGVRIGR